MNNEDTDWSAISRDARHASQLAHSAQRTANQTESSIISCRRTDKETASETIAV